jgi:hypothetical protein
MDKKNVLTRSMRLIRKGWGKGDMAGNALGADDFEGYELIIMESVPFDAPKVAYVCARGGLDRALWMELGKPDLSTLKARQTFTKHARELHDLLDDVAIEAAYEKFGGEILEDGLDGPRYLDSPRGSISGVIDFNDHEDTTQDEVLAVFKAAKKRLG